MIMVIAGMLAFARILNINTDWEHYLIHPEIDMPFMTGRMSLVTALLFVGLGGIFLMSVSKKRAWHNVSTLLTVILLIISVVLLMGYMYRAPFYYKGDFIPPAALTVGLFFLILASLVAIADKETYFHRKIQSNSTSARLFKVFLPATLALIFLEDFVTIRLLPEMDIHPVYSILIIEFIFVTVAGYLFFRIANSVGKSLDHANKELKKTNVVLHAILDLIPFSIFWKNKDSVYVGCNKPFADNAGFATPAEMIGKDDYTLPWAQYAEEYRADDQKVINSGESKLFYEEIVPDRDGVMNYVLTSKVPLKDDEGRITGVLGSFMDITERKKVEDSLKERDIRLRKLSMHVPGMIYQFTRRIDGTYSVPYSTDAIQDIFGCSLEEVIEDFSPIARVVHPEDLSRLVSSIELSAETLGVWQCEYRVAIPGKEVRWMFGQATPERLPDGQVIWHGFNSDITERKRIEAEVIQAKDAAEESSRLKSAFLANMSHEIRTPMNGIMGFTSLLTEPDLTSEEKDHYIDVIHKSGQRMLNTLNDIIEVSIIETGQVSLTLSEVNAVKIVDELCTFFRPEAEKKGISLQLSTDCIEFMINTDQAKFTSIITNLIKNAVKYTDSGFIRVGINITGENLEIGVHDTGIGIPEENHDSIFNRFEKVNLNPDRVYDGSGLGLSISKSYVEKLGGTIRVESVVGKGSNFVVSLPVGDVVPAKQLTIERPCEGGKEHFRGLRVLVVEDDPSSSEYMSIMLKCLVSELYFAASGHEAVRISQEHPDLDIILMDISIPGGDGYETTRKIRSYNQGVMIFAQTAHAMYGDRQKSMDAGCNDHITKPILKNDLLLLIEKHCK